MDGLSSERARESGRYCAKVDEPFRMVFEPKWPVMCMKVDGPGFTARDEHLV